KMWPRELAAHLLDLRRDRHDLVRGVLLLVPRLAGGASKNEQGRGGFDQRRQRVRSGCTGRTSAAGFERGHSSGTAKPAAVHGFGGGRAAVAAAPAWRWEGA